MTDNSDGPVSDAGERTRETLVSGLMLPLLLLLFLTSPASAQAKLAQAVVTETPPTIDGVIDPDEWKGAALLESVFPDQFGH